MLVRLLISVKKIQSYRSCFAFGFARVLHFYVCYYLSQVSNALRGLLKKVGVHISKASLT